MWLLAQPAFALDWYLESPDRADRSEPSALEEAASASGFDARVVRRFTEGEGWRYVARVEGFADGTSARVAARELAEQTGVSLVVIEVEGTKASRVDDIAPVRAEHSQHNDPIGPDPEEEAERQLSAMAAAHAVGPDLLAKLRSGPVRFEYTRTLPDDRVAHHRWAAADNDLYVEIWGDVPARRLRVVNDRAELSMAGSPFTQQQLEPSQTVAASLGPAEVIPAVFALAASVNDRREFGAMSVTGASVVGGVETISLGFGGDGTSGAIDLEIGARDHLVRRVAFDTDARVYELSDFRAVGGAKIPFSVTESRDGAIVDRVKISLLDVDTAPPSEWFIDAR